MTPPTVCDASALVAVLLDDGPDGQWASRQLSGSVLCAPVIAPFETANIIRRHERAGIISTDQSEQAQTDLMDLPMELWPYEAVSHRAWQLRHNLSIYDAAYVAVAEAAGGVLVTLDRRIAEAPGVSCPVLVPHNEPPSAQS